MKQWLEKIGLSTQGLYWSFISGLIIIAIGHLLFGFIFIWNIVFQGVDLFTKVIIIFLAGLLNFIYYIYKEIKLNKELKRFLELNE